MLRGPLALTALCLAGSSLWGCALEPEGHVAMTGVASGTDAVVGASASADRITVYLCGGEADVATRTHWFEGAIQSSGAIAIDTGDGWRLEGVADGEGARGVVHTPDGDLLHWSARPVEPGTVAGLYSVVSEGCRTGVVVTQGGADAEPRAQGAWCSGAGAQAGAKDIFEQVTPIFPIALQARGIHINVRAPGEMLDLYAAPVEP